MKTIKSSDAFVEWYENIRYEKTRNGYFLVSGKKPTKRILKEAHNLFSSFGGVEYKTFKWEFTYDPVDAIANAIKYGYIFGAKQNFCFIPDQIQANMDSLFTCLSGGKVYYPFYGYGQNTERHLKYKHYYNNSLLSDKTIFTDKYDGAFFRPPLGREFIALVPLWRNLNSGALITFICENSSLLKNDLDEHLDLYYEGMSVYKIPSPTWTPQYAENSIYASIVCAKRK